MSTTATVSLKIAQAVGWGGANRPTDVLVVKRLLNQCIGLLVPYAPLAETGQCTVETTDMIREFQRRVVKSSHPDGRVDPHGRTLEALLTCAAGKTYMPPSASATGKKYTNSANEVVTERTTPTAKDVVQMLLSAWPELKQTGARTLTAQFMAETGDGRYCFNWNLGNVKAKADERHMYLSNVWECEPEATAKASVAKSGGLAHVATAAECAKHGWNCPDATVVYQPPHAACRFRAYVSLAEGAQRWVDRHKRIAQHNSKYLPALTGGDVPGAAKALKQAGYYTASETSYASLMTAKKKRIDTELGPP